MKIKKVIGAIAILEAFIAYVYINILPKEYQTLFAEDYSKIEALYKEDSVYYSKFLNIGIANTIAKK